MRAIDRERLEAYLAERDAVASLCITPRADGAAAPLSAAQQQIWLHAHLAPQLPLYNEPFTIRRRGPLDPSALQTALTEIVRRHEAWRTTIQVDAAGPVQVVQPPFTVALPLADLTTLPLAAREAEAARLATEDAVRPFDLERGPLLRVLLVRMSDEDHRLYFTVHHVVLDGVSIYQILLDELTTLYDAFLMDRPSPLPDLDVQYADFAVWQRERLQGAAPEVSMAWWRRRLADLPVVALPTDRPRPAVQDFAGARQCLALPPGLSTALRALARREGTSLFMVLLAAFEVLLHRYTGQTDLAIGTVSAGRGRPEIERLLGFFANPLCLRADVSGDPTFSALLARVREESLEALAHDDVPFETVVKALGVERDAGRNPLFQVAFSLEAPRAAVADGWDAGHLDVDTGTSKFDLYLELDERPETIVGRIVYRTNLFEPATIERLARQYQCVLRSAVEDPRRPISALTVLDGAEHKQLMAWSTRRVPYPDTATVHGLFEAQAARTPDGIAVVAGNRSVSYAELDARADELAARLRRRGVRPDVPVGVYLERSLDTVIAFLGIMKADGAYVPLDPAYPAERLRFMLADAGVTVAVTNRPLRERFPAPGLDVVVLEDREAVLAAPRGESTAGPDSLAYVMFTSGSTGRPKGVAVQHRGIVRLLFGQTFARLDATRTVMLTSTTSFDVSTFELWGALLHGGRSVIYPPGVPTPDTLRKLIRDHRVTTVWLTASLFNTLIDEAPDALRGVDELLAGGEALSPTHVRRAQALLPDTMLINGYGPTECTTFACCHRLVEPLAADAASVPIGAPIANTEAFVLDTHGGLAPLGAVGELYLGGPGLARGYINRAELTAERFVPHPFDHAPGARLYRTGDLVRWRNDGTLEFLGRADSQVKIRGFRIELGEIESVLVTHPGVREAVVLSSERGSNERALVAYVVPRATMPEPDVLRNHLRARLPAFMIPSVFFEIPAVPRTPVGKVDRAALPSPAAAARAARQLPARDPLEARLLALWEDVLGVRGIGVKDDFFALGGHSLVAVRLMRQIERLFGQALPLNVLYSHPTVEDVARLLLRRERDRFRLPAQVLHEHGRQPPLFFFHGDLNGAGFYCRDLARHLGPEQPLYAIHPLGLDGGPVPPTIEAMAAEHLALIRQVQPHGPYRIGGYCNGGLVAYETARCLAEAGELVEPLVLIAAAADTRLRRVRHVLARAARWLGLAEDEITDYFGRLRYLADRLAGIGARAQLTLAFETLVTLGDEIVGRLRGAPHSLFSRTPIPADAGTAVRVADELLSHETYARYFTAVMAYVPPRFDGKLLVFWPEDEAVRHPKAARLGWARLAREVKIIPIPGDHHTVVTRHAELIARTILTQGRGHSDALRGAA